MAVMRLKLPDGSWYELPTIKGDKGDKGDPGAIKMIPVSVLPDPSEAEEDAIYLVPSSDPQSQNTYDEYVVVNGQWEKIGSGITADLDDYYTKSEVNTLLNDKADADDIPTALSELTDDATHRLVSDTEKAEWNAKADADDIPTALSELTDDATHRLVTDAEKAEWDAKADADDVPSAAKQAEWDAKADADDIPTALSELTDDATHRLVTDTEKATWDAKADADDIPTALSELTDDSTHRLVSDTEKTEWTPIIVNFESTNYTTAKALADSHPQRRVLVYWSGTYFDAHVALTSTSVTFTALDESSWVIVFSVDRYSNRTVEQFRVAQYLYQLTDDATHRLVSDTEKATWNAKSDTSDIPTALSDLSDDSTHRLVTDTEKASWNGKASANDISSAIAAHNTSTTAHEDIREIAAGKTTNYVCSSLTNPILDSTDDIITLTGDLVDIHGDTVDVDNLKEGDNIYVSELSVYDRWYAGDNKLYRLETAKVPVTDVQFKNSTVVVNGIAHIPSTLASFDSDATHRLVTDTEKATWNGKTDSVFAVDYNNPSWSAAKAAFDAHKLVIVWRPTYNVLYFAVRSLLANDPIVFVPIRYSCDFTVSYGNLGVEQPKITLQNDDTWSTSGYDTRSSSILETTLTGASNKLPTSAAVKTYVDGAVPSSSKQAEWDAKADASDIPTALSELTADTTHRLVTDDEKAGWDAKADASDIPTAVSDLTNDAGYLTLATLPVWDGGNE